MSARTRRRITPERARSIGAAILVQFPSGIVETTREALAALVGVSVSALGFALADLEARGAITRETRREGAKVFGLVLRVTSAGRSYLEDAPRNETIGHLRTPQVDTSHRGEAASGGSQKAEDDKATSVVTEISSRKPAADDDRIADTAMADTSGGHFRWTPQCETQIVVVALREIRDALKAQTEALLSLRAVRSTASQPVAAPPPRAQAQDAISPEDEAKVEKASGEALRAHVAAGKEVRTTPEALRIGMANKMREALLAGNRLEVDVLCKAADERAASAKRASDWEAKKAQWEAEAKAHREAHQAKQAAERERRKNVIPMPRTGS